MTWPWPSKEFSEVARLQAVSHSTRYAATSPNCSLVDYARYKARTVFRYSSTSREG
jgi:hypothetical protein